MRGAGAGHSRAESLDRLEIPRAPLDILAQQIVATAAADDWNEDDLVRTGASALIRIGPWPRRDFDAVVEMLSEGIATSRGRRGAYLHRDQVNGIGCGGGAARGWRRSRPAARFRRPRNIR